MKNNFIYTIGVVVLMASCKTNLKTTDVQAGNVNFKRYVAIGNSLTSGFANGGLSYEGQVNSFPNMLATQFQQVGGGDFKIPYMNNEKGGNDGSGNPARILGYVLPCGSSTPSISPILNPKGATTLHNVAAQGPYNLVGVPGARAIDVNWGVYSALNAFLQRFAKTPGVSTILTEAVRSNPTFYTLWLGNNDVLAYSIAGAAPSANPLAVLSDTSTFRLALTAMVDTMSKLGAKGAIANVPDVTSVPYFTTVPWNSVVLSQGLADTLNAINAANSIPISWTAGANGLLIVDSSVTGLYMRHATSSDLILLTTPGDSIKCGKWGISPLKPLKDSYVLDKDEVTEIQTRTALFNVIIANLATQYNLAHVNMNSYLKQVKSGTVYNGINMNAAFVSGGVFSLDGVHPNARGYALIANEFLRTINAKFGSSIPMVDVAKYKGVIFP